MNKQKFIVHTWESNEEIIILRSYLSIPTFQPNVNYEPAITFLKEQAEDLGLPLKVHYCGGPNAPIVIITMKGSNPDLPSIMLNSHMDTAPTYVALWRTPPYEAHMTPDGLITGRGAQDGKCVGMQYLAALRLIIKDEITLKRTIHVGFLSDQKSSGPMSIENFVSSPAFKAMNVGFALVAGFASSEDYFHVFNVEKVRWFTRFRIKGTSGHGSLLLENTIGELFQVLFSKIMDFREREIERMERDKLMIADIVTLNLTEIKSGLENKVVPGQMEASFSIFLPIDIDQQKFDQQIKDWCKETGEGVELDYMDKKKIVAPTACDVTNPYWVIFKQTMDDMKEKVLSIIGECASGAIHLRAAGVPTLGFSPINRTQQLHHDTNECLRAEVYMRGIQIYRKLIIQLGLSDFT